jgi:hypothetical protein
MHVMMADLEFGPRAFLPPQFRELMLLTFQSEAGRNAFEAGATNDELKADNDFLKETVAVHHHYKCL